MLKLINGVSILGNLLNDWDSALTILWLVLIQVMIVAVAVALIILFIRLNRLGKVNKDEQASTQDPDGEEEYAATVEYEPVTVEEDSVEKRLRYDRSFTARLIQADDETKNWYTDIKNELLSFKNVHARASWKCETFRYHREVIAKLGFRGKSLCIFLPLNYADYEEEYHVENVEDAVRYQETPLMLRLKNNRRVRNSKLLIAEVMKQRNIRRVTREPIDYYVPYEGTLELINKRLIRRNLKSPDDEAIFERNQTDTTSNQSQDD